MNSTSQNSDSDESHLGKNIKGEQVSKVMYFLCIFRAVRKSVLSYVIMDHNNFTSEAKSKSNRGVELKTFHKNSGNQFDEETREKEI